MQEIKHILFVPHSPEQPINAVILAKKLSKAATALGISNDVATSVEHLDLSNVIDTVVFVGQKPAEADQLRDKVVKVIGLNNAQHDAIMLLRHYSMSNWCCAYVYGGRSLTTRCSKARLSD